MMNNLQRCISSYGVVLQGEEFAEVAGLGSISPGRAIDERYMG